MSALDPLADASRASREVREVPAAELDGSAAISRLSQLLDHPVGDCEDARRNFKAERFGGLEVDDEFEFGRLHHRQVGGFDAFEDAAQIEALKMVSFRSKRVVTHQSASGGKKASII